MENPHGNATYGQRRLDNHYVILGCGAIGSNLAAALVRQGARQLTLVDHDRVDSTNISTTVYTDVDVGLMKVEALANHLWAINPQVDLQTYNVKLDERSYRRVKPLRNVPGGDMVVISCVDNVPTRQLITDILGDHVLHMGIGGNYCEAIWGRDYVVPPEPDPDDIAACGIPYSLNLILLLVGLTVDMLYDYPNQTNIRATLKPLQAY